MKTYLSERLGLLNHRRVMKDKVMDKLLKANEEDN